MKYIIRLDDASPYIDLKKWKSIESLLDKYHIKPIVGIIPNCKDKELKKTYNMINEFWEMARQWQDKGWHIALHGYNHCYTSESGGINPVQQRSEFAGVSFIEQSRKIQDGIRILNERKIKPKVFFAPSHTFDHNTLLALKNESDIRIICDTVALGAYYYGDFVVIPQQSGRARKLPLYLVTFCYHPNTMTEDDFRLLDRFIEKNRKNFISLDFNNIKVRKLTLVDKLLSKIYFTLRRIR